MYCSISTDIKRLIRPISSRTSELSVERRALRRGGYHAIENNVQATMSFTDMMNCQTWLWHRWLVLRVRKSRSVANVSVIWSITCLLMNLKFLMRKGIIRLAITITMPFFLR